MACIMFPENTEFNNQYAEIEKPLIAFKNNVINEGLQLSYSIDDSNFAVTINKGKLVIGRKHIEIQKQNIVDINLDSISSKNKIIVIGFYIDCQQHSNIDKGSIFGFRIAGTNQNGDLIPQLNSNIKACQNNYYINDASFTDIVVLGLYSFEKIEESYIIYDETPSRDDYFTYIDQSDFPTIPDDEKKEIKSVFIKGDQYEIRPYDRITDRVCSLLYMNTGGTGDTGGTGKTGDQGLSGYYGDTGKTGGIGNTGQPCLAGIHIHRQDEPSTMWRVLHNFGICYVNVQCCDIEDNVISPGTIKYYSPDETRINFNVAVAGKAMVIGGGLIGSDINPRIVNFAADHSIVGPRGPQGDPGISGPAGFKGPMGTPGEDGIDGNYGPPGPYGPKGVKGDRGIPGCCGPQGEQGPQGQSGQVGLKGTNAIPPPSSKIMLSSSLFNCDCNNVDCALLYLEELLTRYERIVCVCDDYYVCYENEIIFADSSEKSFSIYLPVNPEKGATIVIIDVSRSFSTNHVTIVPSGQPINGEYVNYSLEYNGMYKFINISSCPTGCSDDDLGWFIVYSGYCQEEFEGLRGETGGTGPSGLVGPSGDILTTQQFVYSEHEPSWSETGIPDYLKNLNNGDCCLHINDPDADPGCDDTISFIGMAWIDESEGHYYEDLASYEDGISEFQTIVDKSQKYTASCQAPCKDGVPHAPDELGVGTTPQGIQYCIYESGSYPYESPYNLDIEMENIGRNTSGGPSAAELTNMFDLLLSNFAAKSPTTITVPEYVVLIVDGSGSMGMESINEYGAYDDLKTHILATIPSTTIIEMTFSSEEWLHEWAQKLDDEILGFDVATLSFISADGTVKSNHKVFHFCGRKGDDFSSAQILEIFG